MKKRGEHDHEVIIKRRSKKGHEEAHGGAWKVAFADFTLAMMALFMVLWVIQPQNKIDTSAAGDQQSNPLVDGGAGVFDGSSRSPIALDGIPLRPEPPARQTDKARGEGRDGSRHYRTQEELQELAALIREVSGSVDALANIEVQVVPQGLRILIKDDQQRFMFQRGSATLTTHFQGLLGKLAEVLGTVDNKLIISGHTDAIPYRGQSGYDNWNLSGERALRARNVMVEAGLPVAAVLQVSAQADVMPLRPEAPESGANRRIEVLLLTSKAETLYRELFGEGYAHVRYSASGAEYVAPPVEAPRNEAL